MRVHLRSDVTFCLSSKPWRTANELQATITELRLGRAPKTALGKKVWRWLPRKLRRQIRTPTLRSIRKVLRGLQKDGFLEQHRRALTDDRKVIVLGSENEYKLSPAFYRRMLKLYSFISEEPPPAA